MTDIGPAIRTALLGDATISGKLAAYSGSKSIHLKRPAPASAKYPMVISAGDVSITNQDMVDSELPVIRRDIGIYGRVKEDYRAVESLGYLVRDLFHRKRESLSVSGYGVVDVRVTGPVMAPTSDDKLTGRVVSLLVRLKKIA